MLQHYGTESPLGLYLTATLENLQLELGVRRCPFEYDFQKWGELATDSWIKALWEKISVLHLEVDIDYKALPLPRENDRFIMEAAEEVLSGYDLVRFNRVRKRQEAMTFSDICTPNGTRFDDTFLHDWQDGFEGSLGRHRSAYAFGEEHPTEEDWKLWRLTLRRMCLGSLSLPTPLRERKEASPRTWRIFFAEEEVVIEVLSDRDGITLYHPGKYGKFTKGEKSLTMRRHGETPQR